jgi:hypothetical protein
MTRQQQDRLGAVCGRDFCNFIVHRFTQGMSESWFPVLTKRTSGGDRYSLRQMSRNLSTYGPST